MTDPVHNAGEYSVSEISMALKRTVEDAFGFVRVRGEISGYRGPHSSGHAYFSLKDDRARIEAVIWKMTFSRLKFRPEEGMEVIASGKLTTYPGSSKYQIVIDSLEPAGAGALMALLEERKRRLAAEGLFDAARKRSLPTLPRAIGLVTSLGAAALHDVVTALRRRVPHIPVVLAPAAVQGAAAPAELVRALRSLFALEMPIDVILLVRGGGSIEDLWAFNDEALARTIVQSPVPVVSGVGHETDFTIADFCADLRAPTPTAAAELVSAPRDVWLGALELSEQKLRDALDERLDALGQRLDLASGRLGRPSTAVLRQQLRLTHEAQRLRYAVAAQHARLAQREQNARQSWPSAWRSPLQLQNDRLDRLAARLRLLDPALVLQRGYAWLTDAQGRAITQTAQARPGDALRARLADGSIDLTVEDATTRRQPTQGH